MIAVLFRLNEILLVCLTVLVPALSGGADANCLATVSQERWVRHLQQGTALPLATLNDLCDREPHRQESRWLYLLGSEPLCL